MHKILKKLLIQSKIQSCFIIFSSIIEDAKQKWINEFESQIDLETDLKERDILLKKLTSGQIRMLGEGENVALVAFAEFVVSALLKYIQKNKTSKIEDLLSDFFLVDPTTVKKRKGIHEVQIRDHKLQILFRIELHWLLANQEDQKKYEKEMLEHLRQISFLDLGPKEMLTFLQEFITPFYVNRHPDLLLWLYEELNQPQPSSLRALFSPSKKSECSRYVPII